VKGDVLQRIGWILAVMLAFGWLASEIPLQNASSDDESRVQTSWRRTVDGWENASQWTFYYNTHQPVFHPLYFGLMQCAAVAWIAISSYLIKLVVGSNANQFPHETKNTSLIDSNPNTA
jgi:hypothetical protein